MANDPVTLFGLAVYGGTGTVTEMTNVPVCEPQAMQAVVVPMPLAAQCDPDTDPGVHVVVGVVEYDGSVNGV